MFLVFGLGKWTFHGSALGPYSALGLDRSNAGARDIAGWWITLANRPHLTAPTVEPLLQIPIEPPIGKLSRDDLAAEDLSSNPD